MWSALLTAGLPNDEYGRDGPLGGRYWLVDEHDGFSEWTKPHPGEEADELVHNGQHCADDRSCFHCDPDNTGQQTVDVQPVRRPWDWLVLGPESV